MNPSNGNKLWKYGSATPRNVLLDLAAKIGSNVEDEQFCKWLDENDELSHLRNEFIIPKLSSYEAVEILNDDIDDEECINYFCGNSLGIQPKATKKIVNKVLGDWATKAAGCYWSGILSAVRCDKYVFESMSRIVGAFEDEVVVMNGLTVNLHLLLISFYQPTEKRHKILLEEKAFPSDHYAIESQIKQRGYDPVKSMLTVKPREAESTWRTEDILDVIDKEGDTIALVMFSGVHYYTGQLFDIEAITKAAHKKGCMVGFDIAHAVGNVELQLHDWDVDFACWCTYKYLNSGPGSLAGAFLHRKHKNNNFPKLSGWWSETEQNRFRMTNKLELEPGIQGYRISNPPPLLVACIRASLDVFDKTDMKKLCEKSFLLTGYLEFLLEHFFAKGKTNQFIEIITPSDYKQRGCQLSLQFSCPVDKIHKEFQKRGVICDIRHPKTVRIAPIPLYNTFRDVYRFVEVIKDIFSKM